MATSARRLRIPHPDLSLSQKTYLDGDYSSGTTITVASNAGFEAQNIAVIGEPSTEKCESKAISSLVAQTSLIIPTALKYTHQKGEILYRSEYDAIEISYLVAGIWTVLQSALPIQWDQPDTIYVHQGGTDSTSYRFRFYNQTSANYSEYSGTLTGAGHGRTTIGFLLGKVREKINDPEKKQVSDQQIISFFCDAKDIIRGVRNDWWFWKRISEGDITTTADVFKYSLDTISTRLDYIGDVRYRYDDGNIVEIYPIDFRTDNEFDQLVRDENRTNDDWVSNYNIMPGDTSSVSGYIQVDPRPKTTSYGSFYIRWYENEASYTSVTDTTDIPLPNLLINFAIAQCERIKGNETKAKIYEDLFYGPSEEDRNNRAITGIALLESLQKGKGRAIKQARALKSYMGRNYRQRNYRNPSGISNDARRENYF